MEKLGDTNLFYDLGAHRFALSDIITGDDTLVISPVSVLEIVSKISERTFAERQAAAQAALEHATLLEDPERFLERAWNVPFEEDEEPPWYEGLVAVQQARDPAELERGVQDWTRRVIRTVDIRQAAVWRDSHYRDFVAQMEAAAEQLVPGYQARRARGQMKQANAETRQRVSNELADPGVLLAIVLATRDRAWLEVQKSGRQPPSLTKEVLENALPKVTVYAMAYRRYLELVSTEYAPDTNDWGDLECFLYLNENRVLVTSDKRWLGIARSAGLSDFVVQPSASTTTAVVAAEDDSE